MAAAYRVVDRTHPPLTSPLEDPNPSTAHLKIYWPSSFQRLQETTLQSNFSSATDYSITKPHEPQLGIDNLIILNVYKTTDHSASWGLGPSPLSPLYICYPVLHPADRSLPEPPRPVSLPSAGAIFSNKDRKLNTHDISSRPNVIQIFLDRKDFSTHASSTVACIRFLEEFVAWRLIPKTHISAETKSSKASNSQGDNTLTASKPRSFLGRIALKRAASMGALPRSRSTSAPTPPIGGSQETSAAFSGSGATTQPKDMPAAHIFLTPTIRPVDQRPSKPLLNLFTSLVSDRAVGILPMYTTLEEVAGQAGIKLFFSDTGKKTYWWVWENASWRVVFDPAEKGSVKKDRVAPKEPKVDETNGSRDVSRSGRSLARNDSIGEASERNLKPDSSGSNIKNHFRRSASDSKKSKNPSLITSGVVKLYAADQLEPVASAELSTGQMWIVKSVMLGTIDIAVAVMFAVVNLERVIQEEHD